MGNWSHGLSGNDLCSLALLASIHPLWSYKIAVFSFILFILFLSSCLALFRLHTRNRADHAKKEEYIQKLFEMLLDTPDSFYGLLSASSTLFYSFSNRGDIWEILVYCGLRQLWISTHIALKKER